MVPRAQRLSKSRCQLSRLFCLMDSAASATESNTHGRDLLFKQPPHSRLRGLTCKLTLHQESALVCAINPVAKGLRLILFNNEMDRFCFRLHHNKTSRFWTASFRLGLHRHIK
jgi:hypothetical protein